MRQREDEANWAVEEFGQAELGDQRRTARLVQVATAMADQPRASLPEACGDPATLKAAYRFFATAAITPEAIVASHVQAALTRLRAVPLVLAVNDTTFLDWTTHPATTGLGPLASRHQQGLVLHSTLACTPDRLPLGVLALDSWARDAATFGQPAAQRPIDDKESKKWLTSLAVVATLAADCPTTRFIHIGDAEADVYDLFLVERPPGVELLVRAGQNRRVEHAAQRLWEALATTPVATRLLIDLPRQPQRPARQATVAVHFDAVTLCPPSRRTTEHLAPVRLWAVWVVEEDAPADAEPIEWLLLTTVPTHTPAAAEERLRWYGCRWGIEVWHKVLKSGCQIEARRLGTADRLERCLAVYAVIAWRLLQLTMLARAAPDLPCTAVLEEDEWQALWCTIHQCPTPPPTPPTLAEAVRWIARLGGHLGRRGDGEPGVTIMWKGWQHLTDLTTMYRIMKPTPHHRDVGKS